jgi:hypothetical protein
MFKLYKYKGGGYPGCFFEWNFAAIYGDDFYDIFSSGRHGCKTREELDALIEGNRQYYMYGIEELETFADESNAGHVLGVAKFLYDELGIEFEVECYECGRKFPAQDLRAADVSCPGGIALQYNSLVCEDCYDEEIHGQGH